MQTGSILQACWNSNTGVLTLKNVVASLTLTRAKAEEFLQGVTYINSNVETPGTAPRRFKVTVEEPFSTSETDMNLYIAVIAVGPSTHPL